MTARAPAGEQSGALRAAFDTACDEIRHRADLMLALIALCPRRLGGMIVEGASPDAAACLSDRLGAWTLAAARPLRLPLSISDDRLCGGLDLAATLAAGRPIAQMGLLAAADTGALIVPMAERLPRRIAAQIARALDCGAITVEREGVSRQAPARFSLLLLSDPATPDESVPEILSARLAFRLPACMLLSGWQPALETARIVEARTQLDRVEVPGELFEAITAATTELGVTDIRVLDFVLATIRGLAALDGAEVATPEHARRAADLVLASRIGPPAQEDTIPPQPPEKSESEPEQSAQDREAPGDLAEIMVAAAHYQARLDLEMQRKTVRKQMKGESAAGKSGDMRDSWHRGSRLTARPGDPRRQGRLDLIATLLAAAPWQRLRPRRSDAAPIAIRASDFRLKRFRHRSEAVVIFAVDASGSTAMNRLAEAKGAIEHLLSGCYSRRELVALLAFRREGAEILLPPTRSLTRVKRSLAGLPGGGGTPLAAGISAAQILGEQEQRRRRTPHIVFLSDGQANVALNGEGGREMAAADASRMALRLRGAQLPILFFDTSRRPSAHAQRLSEEMGAAYRMLPFADARQVSDTVRTVLLS
ncbi:MAG: VWA domain-containing protein [Hyphomonas sp.]